MMMALARGILKSDVLAARPISACRLPRDRLAPSVLCCLPLQLASVLS